MDRFRDSSKRMGDRPEGLTGAGAVSLLCGVGPYDDEVPRARFGEAPVHLPERGGRPLPFSRLLGDGRVDTVRALLDTMPRSKALAREARLEAGLTTLYGP